VKLVDQWEALETNLPDGWDDVRLTLTTEQPGELARAAQVLGPMNAGRFGDALVLHVRRAGGASGPEAARRLFSRLDRDRVWCQLSAGDVQQATDRPPTGAGSSPGRPGVATQWDAALATLPPDWSDLLCGLELDSSDLLPRAALLCAPLNPTRDPETIGFVFRCARRAGYGVSPNMARRCFERLDEEEIPARVTIRRVLVDAHNVATQGVVWPVDGRVL
jgi:hypothetical protein